MFDVDAAAAAAAAQTAANATRALAAPVGQMMQVVAWTMSVQSAPLYKSFFWSVALSAVRSVSCCCSCCCLGVAVVVVINVVRRSVDRLIGRAVSRSIVHLASRSGEMIG